MMLVFKKKHVLGTEKKLQQIIINFVNSVPVLEQDGD